MPVLNSRGDVLAGAGGHPGSLNRAPFPFPSFGGACWLDDDTVLVQIPAPAPLDGVLATWRPGDAQPTPLPDQRGANDYGAGGGRFIAWLSGYGCWGTLGHLPAAAVPNAGTAFAHLAVAPDGTIGYIPNQAYGYGLAVVSPDGVVDEAPGIWALDEQTLPRAAIWRGGALGTAVPTPAHPAVNLQVVDLPDGERWLVYWADGVGFVAQRDGEVVGYILGTTPTFFNHHARAVNGELWIAWSSTPGEAPGDVAVVQIDRTLPRELLVGAPPIGPIDPPPIGPIDPPPDRPPVERPPDRPPIIERPPDPEPQPPEDSMLTIDMTTPLIKAASGNKVDAGDGYIAVEFVDVNGKVTYLSVDSGGTMTTDKAESIGPDEKFKFNGSALVNTNTYDGVKVVMIPCVETA